MAMILGVSNVASTGVMLPHDPVLMISTHASLRIYTGILFFVALVCLYERQKYSTAIWILWLAASFWIYQASRIYLGGHGINVYLENIHDAFGVSTKSLADLLIMIFLYLPIGGILILSQPIWKSRSGAIGQNSETDVKIYCESCGGKIQFPSKNIGRETACPHCNSAIILQGSRNLKMACVLCGGHIEFPSHALGQKISCPHCAKRITLLLKLTF